MNPTEAKVLLGMASIVDNRKPDENAAVGWAAMLHDLTLADCQEAVRQHFQESTEWLMPAHIRDRVRKIRARRVHDGKHLLDTPPPDLSVEQWRDWRAEMVRRLASGEDPTAMLPVAELKPRNVSALIGGTPSHEFAGSGEFCDKCGGHVMDRKRHPKKRGGSGLRSLGGERVTDERDVG
jgi:hypothetical protein